MIVLRDIKRFGFARRPDGTVITRSDIEGLVEPEAKTETMPIPDDDEPAPPSISSFAEQQAAPDLPNPARPSSPLSERHEPFSKIHAIEPGPEPHPLVEEPFEAPEEATDPDTVIAADGPLKRTAYTERLRAEMDGGAAAEPPAIAPPAESGKGWKAKPKLQNPDFQHAVEPSTPAGSARSFGVDGIGGIDEAGGIDDTGHLEDAGPVDAIASQNIGDDEKVAETQALLREPELPTGETDAPTGHAEALFGEPEPLPGGLVDDDPDDDFDDVAVTIGRVVSIRGSVVWGALFDDVGGQASKAARMGAMVTMSGPESRVFGIVNSLERAQQAGTGQVERTIFEIHVLGEIADRDEGFRRGVSSYPPLDAPITTVTRRDIGTIYARPTTSNVHVGQLRHNPKVPAFVLTDSLLGKHFAVLGTTGAGKSCSVTVILQSILNQHPLGHIVLLDPHNEYGRAFGDRAELLNPRNLQLPYWLLNFEEIEHILLGDGAYENRDAHTSLLKDAILHAKKAYAGVGDIDSQITVDTPVPYRLSDLVANLKDGMGMLNTAAGSSRYLSLMSRIESLRSDKRYSFMFSSITVRDSMEQILAQLLRIPTKGKPLTIIDISGLPSEIVDVVVSVLFRLTFELAVWSERGKAPPVLLVCEEAHRYVPEEVGVGFAPTKRVISRIAKEGRKYGVTLCLVSQRPSELAINSLAQCNTIFALRLSNEHDQAFVARTLSENSRWLVDSLPSLNPQEAVVVGDGVTVPVHIRFKDLDPNHRPASHDPSFSKSWRHEADDTFLRQAINRWRSQTR